MKYGRTIRKKEKGKFTSKETKETMKTYRMFAHTLPFDAREVFVLTAMANAIYTDDNICESFRIVLGDERFNFFKERLEIFVSRASRNHPALADLFEVPERGDDENEPVGQ
jgi:hypothetical protein